jgi:hypothetical protein
MSEGEHKPSTSKGSEDASEATGQGESAQGTTPAVVDAGLLASILSQARGPILDRICRQLKPFTGDGSIEITEWIADYERFCTVERVAPAELISYMLNGSAARVHARMRVGEASQWDVVKAALTAEYAMPRQEAWRRFVSCQLETGETVDVYLERLERLGVRLGLSLNDLSFRVKFYEGLPSSIYEWAVTHEHAYTADFGSVLSRVRDRLVSRRAVEGRSRGERSSAGGLAAASGKQQGSGVECYRCGGAHRVKECTRQRSALPRKAPAAKPSAKKRSGCFRCGSIEHMVRDCPKPAPHGAAAQPTGSGQGFRPEDADRGGASSSMETE